MKDTGCARDWNLLGCVGNRCPSRVVGAVTRRIVLQLGPLLCGLLVSSALSACAPSRPQTLVDLTYPFDEQTIYWPTNKSFQWEKTDWGMTASGYWFASANFSASEHGGTHIDAPVHFARGRSTVDQIPPSDLIGPAVVIDVQSKCQANPDYELTVEDIKQWEAKYGRIQEGSLVLMWSGWGARWPDKARYLGSDTPHDPRTLHFPGFSRDAAMFLATERAVRGVGIDTASIDPGRSRDFPAHQVLSAADVYALENVAALDRLPPWGATIFALPMKIKGGTGGPVRIIAMVP
ncbi:MAG: cyclase family protein [Nitrospirota bacterium]|nr:cyclase family protein [Nitrospirota bacterium]